MRKQNLLDILQGIYMVIQRFSDSLDFGVMKSQNLLTGSGSLLAYMKMFLCPEGMN